MDLSPHLEAILTDVHALSGPDEHAQEAAERLARALEPALQVRLLDALGQASLELSDQLPTGHVEVRLAGRDARMTYVGQGPSSGASEPEEDDGTTARLTLRMPEHLKTKVERAAAAEGASVNAWLVRTIANGVDARRIEVQIGRTKTGTRITGFAQS
jgi:hypothetical protein